MGAPKIMVAPNGARRGKDAHPKIPLTIAETAECAAACAAAGAHAIHAHLRDAQGRQLLDAVAYREMQAAIAAAAPSLELQITTESAGRYSAEEQRQLLYALAPPWTSIALREMLSDGDDSAAQRLYHWAQENNVRVQHIVYSPDELARLAQCVTDDIVPAVQEVLFVLGSYSGTEGTPEMLPAFLQVHQQQLPAARFMVCAFGKMETACLIATANAGGDCRIGFENNLWRNDGTLATDNAERVAELVVALRFNE